MKAPIRDRLRSIADSHQGRLTPADVVTDAKRADSPLHALFDWDVKSAARKHWLEQARQIIRSVNVTIQTGELIVCAPCYVRDSSAERDQGYRAIIEVRNDVDRARETLLAEFERVGSMLQRSKTIARVLDLERELDALIGTVEALHTRVEEVAVT